jgi:hypothetical protein
MAAATTDGQIDLFNKAFKHYYTGRRWESYYHVPTGFRMRMDCSSTILPLLTDLNVTDNERKIVLQMEDLRATTGNEDLVGIALKKAFLEPSKKSLTTSEDLIFKYMSLFLLEKQKKFEMAHGMDLSEPTHPAMAHVQVRALRVIKEIMYLRGISLEIHQFNQPLKVPSCVTEMGVYKEEDS